MEKHPTFFIDQLVIQNRYDTPRVVIKKTQDVNNHIYLLPKEQKTSSYLGKTNEQLFFDDEYKTSVTDVISGLTNLLSTLQTQIEQLSPELLLIQQSFTNLPGYSITNGSTENLWYTTDNTAMTQFQSEMNSLGTNSNFSSFTPLHSGAINVILNYNGGNTGYRLFRLRNTSGVLSAQGVSYSYDAVSAVSLSATVTAGVTYEFYFTSLDVSQNQKWDIIGFTFLFDRL